MRLYFMRRNIGMSSVVLIFLHPDVQFSMKLPYLNKFPSLNATSASSSNHFSFEFEVVLGVLQPSCVDATRLSVNEHIGLLRGIRMRPLFFEAKYIPRQRSLDNRNGR